MLNLKAGTSSSVTHCAMIRWMESGRRVSPLRINHSGSISLSIIRTNRSSYSRLEQRHEPMVKSIRAKRRLMEKRAGSRINDKFRACSTGNCEDGCVVCSFPSRKQPLIFRFLTFERFVQFVKQRYIVTLKKQLSWILYHCIFRSISRKIDPETSNAYIIS